MVSPEHNSPSVRRLLTSDVGDVLVTTNIETGVAWSDGGHMWFLSPDETPDALHARAVRTIQIVQET